MKKMISLLSVALFAVTFAAGCGKHTKCDQAKTKADCAKEKFEKPDDFKCVWTPKADAKTDEEKNKNGTCAEPAAPYTVVAADTAKCAAAIATTDTKEECEKGAAATDKFECQHTAGVSPAKGTCVAVAKK